MSIVLNWPLPLFVIADEDEGCQFGVHLCPSSDDVDRGLVITTVTGSRPLLRPCPGKEKSESQEHIDPWMWIKALERW